MLYPQQSRVDTEMKNGEEVERSSFRGNDTGFLLSKNVMSISSMCKTLRLQICLVEKLLEKKVMMNDALY